MTSSGAAYANPPLIALPKPLAPPPRFLAPEATPAQLLRATAANHQKWFERGAISLTLSNAGSSITWLCKQGEIIIPFPRLTDAIADARLDHALADCRKRAPRQVGCWSLMPLHQAVERDNVELVRLILSAHPDLNVQDTQFHGTPPGWARHLERTEIIALIEHHQASS